MSKPKKMAFSIISNLILALVLLVVQSLPSSVWGHKDSGGVSVAVPPNYVCPEGYKVVGSSCLFTRVTQGTYSCPKHTDYFENGACVKTAKSSKILKCPPGSNTDGKKCTRLDTISPIIKCSKNAVLNEAGTSCIIREYYSPQKTCPIGFHMKGHHCVSTKEYPRTPSCPPGYVLQTFGDTKGDECVSIQLVAPDTSCPKGYDIRGGVCVKTHLEEPLNAKCPHGYKKSSDDTCEREIVSEPAELCTSGRLDAHKNLCVHVDAKAPTPSCKKGYVFQGSACVKVEEAKLDEQCPKGYSRNEKEGHLCTHYESYLADHVCPPGSIAQDKDCFNTIEQAPDTYCHKGIITPAGSCVETLFEKPQFVCSPGYVAQDGICVLETAVGADITCPPGSQLNGKNCVRYSRLDATLECKNGETATAEGCISLHKKSPGLACPDGYHANGDTCIQVLESDPHYLCPGNSHLKGEKCESVRKVTAQKVCPKNYILDSQGNCFNSKFAEPTLSCPHGYEIQGGKCIHPKASHHGKKRLLGSSNNGSSGFRLFDFIRSFI